MIVRIAGEGQYRLDEAHLARLNELDNRLTQVVARGDADAFRGLFAQFITFVRGNGERLPDDELVPSDVYLPPPDTTAEEAADLFKGEGLVPG